MKQTIKKWILGFITLLLLVTGLLLLIILNPNITYANKTMHQNFTVYHNDPLDTVLLTQLDAASGLIKTSEFYDASLKIDICLNDGSFYTKLIKMLRGQAFAWGFYNKVVLQGEANFQDNYVSLNGYNWNLRELLAHEIIHCMQFEKLGFWDSNPMAKIPNWKWEGYAEFIARQNTDHTDLSKNLERLNASDENIWEIVFADSTIVSRAYYEYWTLVQYCMEIKGFTFEQLLEDTSDEQLLRKEMMDWLTTNQNNVDSNVKAL
jgi:hypothetical protein